MTEIKGARIHQKEGMTVDGEFHIDHEEVRADLTCMRGPALSRFIRRLRWEFGLIALVMPFGYIKNVHIRSPTTSLASFLLSVIYRKPKQRLGLCEEMKSDSPALLLPPPFTCVSCNRTQITLSLPTYLNGWTDGGKRGKSNHNLLSP